MFDEICKKTKSKISSNRPVDEILRYVALVSGVVITAIDSLYSVLEGLVDICSGWGEIGICEVCLTKFSNLAMVCAARTVANIGE